MSYHESTLKYGRPSRSSNLSSRWNSSIGGIGSARRNSYFATGTSSAVGKTSGSQAIATGQRRAVSSGVNSQPAVNQVTRKTVQNQSKAEYARPGTSVQRNTSNVKPAYNSVNRTYTPSYNNPRMSTRPSYNNSKVYEGVNRNTNNSRIYNNSGSVRQGSNQNYYNNARSNSSGNSVQRRSSSSSGYYTPSNQYRSSSSRSSVSYSAPARSSYSSGSYGGSSSSSGSSSRSSSSSSGSSGSESRSSSSGRR